LLDRQRDLVERRAWISRDDFLDGVALGQAMPGPLAAQVVMWLGFLRAGIAGAALTAAVFIAPSFALVLAVAVVYARYQGLPVVQALFYGVGPAVMAMIAVAGVKLARLTNRRDTRLWAISVVLGEVTAATGAEIAVLFLAAGLLMLVWDAPPRWLRRRPASTNAIPAPAALLALPQLAAAATGGGVLLALGWFFLKAGAFIFGSGLAIVPFLRQGVVHDHHWLTDAQFLHAVAMGLITPGPVVITATFVGYLAAGITGAIVATVAIFIPIYLGVAVPGPWILRHRDNPQIKALVAGATAAAAGAIAGAVGQVDARCSVWRGLARNEQPTGFRSVDIALPVASHTSDLRRSFTTVSRSSSVYCVRGGWMTAGAARVRLFGFRCLA
jgi:chromate transporter